MNRAYMSVLVAWGCCTFPDGRTSRDDTFMRLASVKSAASGHEVRIVNSCRLLDVSMSLGALAA